MREKKLVEDQRLRLLVLESGIELGRKIDEHLLNRYGYDSNEYTFMLDNKESWFSDGCEKVEIMDSVRGMSTFILTDVYNYSVKFKMRGIEQHASPNDLKQQLEDAVGACNDHCRDLSIIMPMLYASRQHRRKGREALTCSNMLHQFDMKTSINRIITCDVHDQGVEQALYNTEFENIYLTNDLLENFINNASINELKDIVFVAPDYGAVGRTTVYLNSFNHPNVKRELGIFYKERDYNNVVDGKNPIIAHRYIGDDNIAGKTALVVDDMIASGNSMLEVIDILNTKGVENIYIFSTFALFTSGIDKFDEYYKQGKFKGVYTTNATYINESFRNREWLHIVDCSKTLSEYINRIYIGKSITSLIQDKSRPGKVLKRKFNDYK